VRGAIAGTLRGHCRSGIRRRFACCVLILAGIIGAASPSAADAKTPNCTAAQKKAADKWLWLNERDKKLSLEQNLPWGMPTPATPDPNEEVLVHWDYVIGYDDALRVPLWTGERVVGNRLGQTVRSDCFRPDPRLPSSVSSSLNDYDEPTFDQGHVTPSADVTISRISVWNSFVLSNMTPQYAAFNRGIWRRLEDYARRWAVANGTGYILTGSIFDRNSDGVRDPDADAPLMQPRKGSARVAIPSAFFKVIALEQPDRSLKTIAFMLPNTTAAIPSQQTLSYLGSRIVTIEAIEHVTGFDLFPSNPRIFEAVALWPIPRAQPRKKTRTKRKATP
jgi:endonuclease G